MESIALCPFCLDSALTGYLPLPRELLRMEKPAAALLLYAVLLDRATLSQKIIMVPLSRPPIKKTS